MPKPPPTIRKLISGNISFERILRQTLGKEEPPMKAGKKGRILAISKKDRGLETLLKHTKPPVRDLMEARIAIKSWPAHIKKLDTISSQAAACGGKLPINLKHYGCHTGRVSGTGGWNALNLGARAHPLIAKVRGLIQAPPGHKLVVCDYSGIEARVCAYIAEIDWLLDAFRAGRDVYIEMAADILGRPVRRAIATDPPPVAAALARHRTLGKVPFLGGIYGVGGARIKDIAEVEYGIDLTLDRANEIIKIFREKCPTLAAKGTGFWSVIEQKFIRTTQYREDTSTNGLEITYATGHDRLDVRLHSGRRLRYHMPRVDTTEYHPKFYTLSPRTKGKRTYMWGGFTTENIVQAFSRDLLVDARPYISKRWPVPLHVYDEMVAVVPEERADYALGFITQVMSVAPAWCSGLPLAAEGKIVDVYCK